MNKIKRRVFSFIFHIPYSIFLFPLLAFAEDSPTITVFTDVSTDLNFTTLADKFSGIVNTVIPFLIGVAFVAIIWGIFKYIRSAGDAEKVAEGKMFMVYGVLGFFMMLSFWGFVMIIKTSLFGS